MILQCFTKNCIKDDFSFKNYIAFHVCKPLELMPSTSNCIWKDNYDQHTLHTSPCGSIRYVMKIDVGFRGKSTCTKCFRQLLSLWQMVLYHKMIWSFVQANWAIFKLKEELKRIHSALTLLHSTCKNPLISCPHEQLTCEYALGLVHCYAPHVTYPCPFHWDCRCFEGEKPYNKHLQQQQLYHLRLHTKVSHGCGHRDDFPS